MSSLPLPESALAQPPQFSNANACKQWLKILPLTNATLAHTTLSAQINLLNRAPIPVLERLKISELLRDPVVFVQQELAKKYSAKPLPLEAAQHHAWSSVAGLWAAMGSAYQLALQACLEGNPNVVTHIALITHRCLRYLGLQMTEHYRAHREIEPKLWQQAHQLYTLAEQQNYSAQAVKDSLNSQCEATTCSAAYAQILLISLANPYHLTARQLALLERWLDKWAVRVAVVATPPIYPDSHATLVQLGVDLDAATGPVATRRAGVGRRLRTAGLRSATGHVLSALVRGGTETQLYPPRRKRPGAGRSWHGSDPFFSGWGKAFQAAR